MTPAIGERIAVVRRSQQLTQSELGALVGYSAVTIGAIEHGRMKLRVPTLARVCEAMGITSADIYGTDWRILCQRGGISLEEPK